MAEIIAFPSAFGLEEVDLTAEAASEFERFTEALTELQVNLEFLRDHFVERRELKQQAFCEAECSAF